MGPMKSCTRSGRRCGSCGDRRGRLERERCRRLWCSRPSRAREVYDRVAREHRFTGSRGADRPAVETRPPVGGETGVGVLRQVWIEVDDVLHAEIRSGRAHADPFDAIHAARWTRSVASAVRRVYIVLDLTFANSVVAGLVRVARTITAAVRRVYIVLGLTFANSIIADLTPSTRAETRAIVGVHVVLRGASADSPVADFTRSAGSKACAIGGIHESLRCARTNPIIACFTCVTRALTCAVALCVQQLWIAHAISSEAELIHGAGIAGAAAALLVL
jgi:hypothetical protein